MSYVHITTISAGIGVCSVSKNLRNSHAAMGVRPDGNEKWIGEVAFCSNRYLDASLGGISTSMARALLGSRFLQLLQPQRRSNLSMCEDPKITSPIDALETS